MLAGLPTELLEQLLSYQILDVTDCGALSLVNRRLYVFMKSRETKSLLRRRTCSALAASLQTRPTLLQMAMSGPLKGLALPNRISRGSYLASPSSLRTFELSARLAWQLRQSILSHSLARRTSPAALIERNIISAEGLKCSPTLMPVVRDLKRAFAQDKVRAALTARKSFVVLQANCACFVETAEVRQVLLAGKVRSGKQLWSRLIAACSV